MDFKDFINSQLSKHEHGGYIRWLDEWEIAGYKNPAQYFKSPLVQEFLTKVDNKTFYKIIKHIAANDKNPVGTPDYIIWNDNKMIFV